LRTSVSAIEAYASMTIEDDTMLKQHLCKVARKDLALPLIVSKNWDIMKNSRRHAYMASQVSTCNSIVAAVAFQVDRRKIIC